jgi:hypothetical protein
MLILLTSLFEFAGYALSEAMNNTSFADSLRQGNYLGPEQFSCQESIANSLIDKVVLLTPYRRMPTPALPLVDLTTCLTRAAMQQDRRKRFARKRNSKYTDDDDDDDDDAFLSRGSRIMRASHRSKASSTANANQSSISVNDAVHGGGKQVGAASSPLATPNAASISTRQRKAKTKAKRATRNVNHHRAIYTR